MKIKRQKALGESISQTFPQEITPRASLQRTLLKTASLYAQATTEVLVETLWPTRCVVCDIPGELLCKSCALRLPYIDYWRTCKYCGAPFGSVQCSECNPVSLKDLGTERLPFDRCVCTTTFDDRTAALVTAFKDQGERRLAKLLGDMMVKTLPPEWIYDSQVSHVSFMPATSSALRRRGFDHAELLAHAIAESTSLPFMTLFCRPTNKDQRALNRQKRLANMEESIHLIGTDVPRSILLIDDVYTTGATLMTAAKVLSATGVEKIRCATFARVW